MCLSDQEYCRAWKWGLWPQCIHLHPSIISLYALDSVHTLPPSSAMCVTTSRLQIGKELWVSRELIPDESCCLSLCWMFRRKWAFEGAKEGLSRWDSLTHTPTVAYMLCFATVCWKQYMCITQRVVTACGQRGLLFVTSYPGQLSEKCWDDSCGKFDTDLSLVFTFLSSECT